nr:hypothetical protein [Tanacetum cinerariifolium]
MAMGLTNMAKRYNGYVVNGFRVRTKGMDNSRFTQNSGVVVIASTTSFSSRKDINPMSGELTYYRKLTDIIEVCYTDETKFFLFKCNWVNSRMGVKVDNFGITSVNFSHLLYKDNNPTDEPFILASQAEQVMYVEDPIDLEWEVAIKMTSRDTFDMGKDGNFNTIVAVPQAQPYSFIMADDAPILSCLKCHGQLRKKTTIKRRLVTRTRNNTTDASVQTSLASSGSGSTTSNDVRKKGRGPALGYQGKEKIKIIFNECKQSIGDSSTDLVNLLGGIAKCRARAPFNIVSWTSMPDTNLDLMWQDVQWSLKKWKSRVKHDFFTPNKDDPEKLLTPPSGSQVNPEQWPDLVNYWQCDDVQKCQDFWWRNLVVRHMTGNKAHLADYQEFKGDSVAFGGSNERITGKGKIKDGKLDFEDVYYVTKAL